MIKQVVLVLMFGTASLVCAWEALKAATRLLLIWITAAV